MLVLAAAVRLAVPPGELLAGAHGAAGDEKEGAAAVRVPGRVDPAAALRGVRMTGLATTPEPGPVPSPERLMAMR